MPRKPPTARFLAEMLADEFGFSDDHQMRVTELHDLWLLWKCVEEMGWTEHTGDWDWFAEVHMKDGTIHGEIAAEHGYMIVGFTFAGIEDMRGFTSCVDSREVTHLALETENGDLHVHVNQIAKIRIEEA